MLSPFAGRSSGRIRFKRAYKSADTVDKRERDHCGLFQRRAESVQVWQQSWIAWVLALVAVGIAAVGVVALRRRAALGASWLAGVCMAVAVWTLAAGLGTAAVPLALKVALAKTDSWPRWPLARAGFC